MNKPIAGKLLHELFPSIATIPAAEWEASHPRTKTFQPGSTLFNRGDAEHYSVFLLSGTVRLSQFAEDGREVLANRLAAGDICAMMVLSGLSERDYPGVIVAETEAKAVFVDKQSFLRWIQVYPPLRNAVFGNILDGMISMGSHLAADTRSLEARLAELLLEKTAETDPSVRLTHQQLAAELGTAREVVSRMLARMRKQGWILAARGFITILDRHGLAAKVGDQGHRR
ncbi:MULTISPECIES: Crp/Fnr family transcriptional regulator [unclassified Paenibacillus]|uniref:Crp/Fnr family transcriptional regulator n=1 Tax=unclassified Paenibacillus TaxID=185978 RepID=UPI000954C13F|nr:MULTISPECIES: Crp/Fnr family transcriptional regulator [unclassified Paenibacillus]ASS68284.2 Crp/Fnr family transcriptional regulator [Paenibacillus sp. RUD330]SIR27443.1 CRP/FNR family transcriptional regulator, anaerobic regulatory protein [Paenibacillus sp. RU4X]SIR40050.1 CRP/FNR family transcriptional regulator, anaerobic regulatory protein [Paenibacillus sp. RU4T]